MRPAHATQMLNTGQYSMTRQQARRRRGVTLLFVISFIVLFLLMGTAFVVVATQFRATSQQRGRIESDETAPKELIYKALYDVVRGPELDNQLSPLRALDILSDQYGYGARGTVSNAVLDPTGQFIILQLQSNQVVDILTNSTVPLSDAPHAYDGLVLTFVDNPSAAVGRVKGISTRILLYEIFDNSGTLEYRFYIAPQWTNTSANPFVSNASLTAQVVGAQVIINGRDFNGTGAGQFDRTANKNTPALSADALQPNQAGKTRAQLIAAYLQATTGPTSASMFAGAAQYTDLGFVGGSPNESYDIADFQNMFLSGGDNIPSFHRPSLAAYQVANSLPLNQVMFRPYYDPMDAANSTANQYFPSNDTDSDLLPNFWDVDNDGDGVLDSVWIDIGMPIQYDENGRRYRPLFAIMIRDMDGRLNVNAHGTNLDAQSNRFATDQALLGGAANAALPKGQYLGPPEISLGSVITDATDYQNILTGRYGADTVPGIAATPEPWSDYKHFDWPVGTGLNNNLGTTTTSSWSSPHDPFGRFGLSYPVRPGGAGTFSPLLPGLDVATSTLTNETTNHPYELSFAGRPFNNISDSPYPTSDLEYFLRPFDKDSNVLTSRLRDTFSTLNPILVRNELTTDSYEVPTAPGHFAQNLFARLVAAGLSAAEARNQIELLLATELAKGLRFDINRPFGDGNDDNSNNVVDDPGEVGNALDDDTDTFIDETDELPAGERIANHPNGSTNLVYDSTEWNRVTFARELFVLAYLVARPRSKDLNGDGLVENSGGTVADGDADVRFLAQWVANIVDYRDADSINFGFEYDDNPYDGWGTVADPIDGDLSTNEGGDRQVVWGAERPELLFMEAIGFHDRRTEDTSDENGGAGDLAAAETDGTQDYDSALRPNPSGFIEIYNPWVTANNAANQRLPLELYDGSGVDLDSVTTGMSDPVWRILVVKDDDQTDASDARYIDPDDPNPAVALTTNDVERSIYFAQPSRAYNQGAYGEGLRYFTNLGVRSLGTGNYAVIGGYQYEPGGVGMGNGYRTVLGRLATATGSTEASLLLANTRGINLIPGAANGVSTYNWNASTSMFETTSPAGAVGIVINQALVSGAPVNRPFSFSGPTGSNYPIVDGGGAAAVATGDGIAYTEPFDLPLDQDSTYQPDADDRAAINANGTTPGFRVVHLQRLANPLLDWNATTNPYLTIDTMFVDLVAFNGAISQSDATTEETYGITSGTMMVTDVERGASETGAANLRRQLWPKEPLTAGLAASTALTDGHHFNFEWRESLGHLNISYSAPYDAPTAFTANAADELHSFPWLKWNNRPYASQLELAEVPVLSSSNLLGAFIQPSATPTAQQNLGVSLASTGAIYNGVPLFGHLPSLYGIQSTSGVTGLGSDLHRLLEFVEVPSRFLGTNQYFHASQPLVANPLLPPFDRFNRFRYPGKLNLNTMNNNAWAGLMNPYSDTLILPNVSATPSTSRVSGFAAGIPTAFPSPFRVANSANHVPPIVAERPMLWCDGMLIPGFSDRRVRQRQRRCRVPYLPSILLA